MPEQEAEKKAGGRPVGSVETPRSRLRADMIAASKLNRGIRELVEEQVKHIRQQLRGEGVTLKERIELMTLLTQSMQNISKGFETSAKLLLTTEDKDNDGGAEKSVEEIMEELRK